VEKSEFLGQTEELNFSLLENLRLVLNCLLGTENQRVRDLMNAYFPQEVPAFVLSLPLGNPLYQAFSLIQSEC